MEATFETLKVLFFTQDDPFYVKLFFDEFFKSVDETIRIEGVVICDVMGKRSFRKLFRQMYGFYGAVDFVRMGARYAAGKVLAACPPIIRRGKSYTLEQLCATYGVPSLRRSGINSPEFLAEAREIQPDLIVSVAAPEIFRKDLIETAKLGCINIHHGKLPRYRGMMPNFWQLYHGEKTVGITVHEINEKIDDGSIILQREEEVFPGETLESLMSRTKRIGAHCMKEAIDIVKNGNANYRENAAGHGSYFSFPSREDVREFKRRGNTLM